MKIFSFLASFALATILGLSFAASQDDEFSVVELPWNGPEPDRFARKVLDEVPRITDVSPSDPDAAEVLKSYLRIMIPLKIEHSLEASQETGNEELSWGLAYDMQAAVAAFQQTRDTDFLDLFELGFDAALTVRDDKLNRKDGLRRRVMPGWGTKAYSEGDDVWITWDALTGMLLYPATKYAGEVLSDPVLGDRKDKAELYLAAAREGVAAFDDWWREDTARNEGYYFDPLFQDTAPLNHINLLGLTHAALCHYFKDEASCGKARKLAEFFVGRFRYHPDGSCYWEYWEGALKPEHRYAMGEDISHAFLNMEFAEYAFRTNVAFERKDLDCIGKVFADHVIKSGADWGANIDGSGRLIAEQKQYGITLFVVLERFSPGVTSKIDKFVRANPKAFPLGWMSYCTGPKAFAYQLAGGL